MSWYKRALYYGIRCVHVYVVNGHKKQPNYFHEDTRGSYNVIVLLSYKLHTHF